MELMDTWTDPKVYSSVHELHPGIHVNFCNLNVKVKDIFHTWNVSFSLQVLKVYFAMSKVLLGTSPNTLDMFEVRSRSWA